jgi:hypothetical protein
MQNPLLFCHCTVQPLNIIVSLHFQHLFIRIVFSLFKTSLRWLHKTYIFYCRLLALGILEYNTDWEAIQQRFLPSKSTHQVTIIVD